VCPRTALGKVREGTQQKRTRTEARQQTNNTSTTNKQQPNEQQMNVSDLGTNKCRLNELVVRTETYCRLGPRWTVWTIDVLGLNLGFH
jgi:hypothetical protein